MRPSKQAIRAGHVHELHLLSPIHASFLHPHVQLDLNPDVTALFLDVVKKVRRIPFAS